MPWFTGAPFPEGYDLQTCTICRARGEAWAQVKVAISCHDLCLGACCTVLRLFFVVFLQHCVSNSRGGLVCILVYQPSFTFISFCEHEEYEWFDDGNRGRAISTTTKYPCINQSWSAPYWGRLLYGEKHSGCLSWFSVSVLLPVCWSEHKHCMQGCALAASMGWRFNLLPYLSRSALNPTVLLVIPLPLLKYAGYCCVSAQQGGHGMCGWLQCGMRKSLPSECLPSSPAGIVLSQHLSREFGDTCHSDQSSV
jgi:hypothetical protein